MIAAAQPSYTTHDESGGLPTQSLSSCRWTRPGPGVRTGAVWPQLLGYPTPGRRYYGTDQLELAVETRKLANDNQLELATGTSEDLSRIEVKREKKVF